MRPAFGGVLSLSRSWKLKNRIWISILTTSLEEEVTFMLDNVCKVKSRLPQINLYRTGDFVGIPDRVHDVLSLPGVTDDIEIG
jgi:hypothetical protein